jgi:hypothetical protein
MRRLSCLAFLVVTFSSGAFADAGGTLYARLGGKSAVTAFVNAGVEQAASLPRTREALAQADLARIKTQLTQRICALSGGGCRAPVADPRTVHLIESLRTSMRDHGVPLAARNELLEVLVPARRDVARL